MTQICPRFGKVSSFDAVVHEQGTILSLQSFKEAIAGKPQLAVTEQPEAPSVALVTSFANRLPTLKEAEEALIPEALRRADGNQGVAAGLLGLARQALNKRRSRHQYPGRTAAPPA